MHPADSTSTKIIPAGEVGAFTVCPRAWKLKSLDKVPREGMMEEVVKGMILHKSWASRYDEAMKLTRHVRMVVALLCAAVTVFLLLRTPQSPGWEWLTDSRSYELLELVPLVLFGLLIAEVVHRAARLQKEESGLGTKQEFVALEGSSSQPVKDYVSIGLSLAGKPDAVILENGFKIPVERKPLAKKLRDRYVAQILVYMRLIEEIDGMKPPYGYLVLGPKCRRVKIENTPDRQQWVDGLIRDMRSILGGAEAKAAVHPKKCAGCDVRHKCPEGRALVQRVEAEIRAAVG